MISALAGTAILLSSVIMVLIIGTAKLKPISPTKPEAEASSATTATPRLKR
jgi:hypothetical protein